jgi:hypothetical protein
VPALELQLSSGLPASPDRLERKNVLTHPVGGGDHGMLKRRSIWVGSASRAEYETSSTEGVQIVRRRPVIIGLRAKRHGHRGPDLQCRALRRCQHQRQKRIAAHLGRPHTVEPELFGEAHLIGENLQVCAAGAVDGAADVDINPHPFTLAGRYESTNRFTPRGRTQIPPNSHVGAGA